MENIELVQLGIEKRNKHNYSEAIRLFSQAIEQGYLDQQVFFQRSYCFSMIKKYKEAITDLDFLIEKVGIFSNNVTHSFCYYNRGLNYFHINQLDKSLEDYTKSISINPNHIGSYYKRSLLYFIKNDFKNCIEDCTKTIELNEKHFQAYYKRGEAKSKLGERQDALNDFNQCLIIQPDFLDALRQRSIIEVDAGNPESAISDLNKILELNPNDSSSIERKKLLQESAVSFQSSEKKEDPFHPSYAFHLRGLSKISIGDYKGALEDYNNAIKIDPNKSNFYYYRSLAKFGSHDKKGALRDQEKSLKLNPEDSKAMFYKAVIEESIKKNKEFELQPLEKKLTWIEYFGACIPAETLSGDFFFIYPEIDKNLINISIGDVQGKGSRSSMFMSIALQLLDEARKKNNQPESILKEVNDVFVQKTGGRKRRAKNNPLTITALYANIEKNSKCSLTYSLAGHLIPIILRKNVFLSEDSLKIESTTSLNFQKDFCFESKKIELESGDLILFYTDGIIESSTEDIPGFGTQRLHNFLKENNSLPLKEIFNKLLKTLKEFLGKNLDDDLTFVCVRIGDYYSDL